MSIFGLNFDFTPVEPLKNQLVFSDFFGNMCFKNKKRHYKNRSCYVLLIFNKKGQSG